MAFQTQTSLFSREEEYPDTEPVVKYMPEFLEHHQDLFNYLQTTMSWNSRFKSRKTVTFGVAYNYKSGIKKVRDMPPFLDSICEQIRQRFKYTPNNCLVNYYPDGNHYISFHSDQDTEMKAQTGVCIISLGSLRNMAMRNIKNPRLRFYYPLQPGSVFFMEDAIQLEWQHGILREDAAGPRISLSFRSLISD